MATVWIIESSMRTNNSTTLRFYYPPKQIKNQIKNIFSQLELSESDVMLRNNGKRGNSKLSWKMIENN